MVSRGAGFYIGWGRTCAHYAHTVGGHGYRGVIGAGTHGNSNIMRGIAGPLQSTKCALASGHGKLPTRFTTHATLTP